MVKFLDAEVAGIILSGASCSADGLRIAAPVSASVLFMLGDNDPHVGGFKFPITAKAAQKCRNFTRSKNTKIVVVKDNKHQYWPWRPEIAKSVAEFIGAKPFSFAKSQPAEKFNLSGKQISAKALYQRHRGHKAFAVNANGTFSWVSEWEFAEDARQFTLYDCARRDHMNVFKLSTHVCSVIDVDGKDMTAK